MAAWPCIGHIFPIDLLDIPRPTSSFDPTEIREPEMWFHGRYLVFGWYVRP